MKVRNVAAERGSRRRVSGAVIWGTGGLVLALGIWGYLAIDHRGADKEDVVAADPASAAIPDMGDLRLVPGRAAVAANDTTVFQESFATLTSVPLPVSGANVAQTDQGLVAVARAEGGGGLRLWRMTLGGHEWSSSGMISDRGIGAAGSVASAVLGGRWVALAAVESSSNSSVALGFVSPDGGASWKTVTAPAFGDLSVVGDAFWLVGGPSRGEAWTSSDGVQWTPVKGLPHSDGAILGVPVATGTGVAVPEFGVTADSPAPISVDLVSGGGARFEAVDSKDGDWGDTDRVVSVAPDGSVHVAAVGSTMQGSGALSPEGSVSLRSWEAGGLSNGLSAISFTSADHGLGIATSTTCPTGKDSCATSSSLVLTLDGGATWSSARG